MLVYEDFCPNLIEALEK